MSQDVVLNEINRSMWEAGVKLKPMKAALRCSDEKGEVLVEVIKEHIYCATYLMKPTILLKSPLFSVWISNRS